MTGSWDVLLKLGARSD